MAHPERVATAFSPWYRSRPAVHLPTATPLAVIVIPAIDTISAQRHALSSARVPYRPGRVDAVRDFARYGFQRLHVSWTTGAIAWREDGEFVRELLFDSSLDVQVQGGVTDADRVRDILAIGARFAIADGRLADDPDSLLELVESFPGEVMLGVDIRCGRILTGPWPGARTVDLLDLTREMDTSTLAGIVVSDSDRRRRSLGPDLVLLEDLVEASDCPIYAAGGIDSVGQLRALDDRSVAGAVVGRAFATGALNPPAVAAEFSA
jgi:phosphoribosylformimino-5-aminoimidazole carboxamide ribotide isomerase